MRIGFIGTGNMGTALIRGYLAAHPERSKMVSAYDKDEAKLDALASETEIRRVDGIADLVKSSDVLFLAVKPDGFEDVLKEIAEPMEWDKKVLVSIAAGVSIGWIEEMCRQEAREVGAKGAFSCKVIRVMPNTPALVGKGMSALSRNRHVTQKEFDGVLELFNSVGRGEEVEESLMDCVTGVSGSGPAYVYLFIEALADEAVALGMGRDQAYTFAAQTVLGAAEMVLATGEHPGVLKDRVCSPGGTTIEAVKALEKNGFRNAVQEAVRAAAEKSRQLKK